MVGLGPSVTGVVVIGVVVTGGVDIAGSLGSVAGVVVSVVFAFVLVFAEVLPQEVMKRINTETNRKRITQRFVICSPL